MLRVVVLRVLKTVRVLPVVGLLAGFVSVVPASAAVLDTASSPGLLTISQSDDAGSLSTATVGQPLTYTITVTNTTSNTANGVFLGDALPPGAKLTGPLPNPNFCA